MSMGTSRCRRPHYYKSILYVVQDSCCIR